MEMEELRKQLGEAIEQGDSYGCSVIIRKMLKLLDPRTALEITLNQVNLHLPAFEELHPEEAWVRRWFELASKFEPINHALLVGGKSGFYDPPGDDIASRAYLHGLSMLDTAFERYSQQKPDVVLELAGNAIECVVNARFDTYLWKQAPLMMTEYDETFRDGADYSLEEQARRLRNFRQHPERRYFIEKYWTQIADEIASELV
ncbi:MAG: hypothetical protein ABI835_04155 [Chloroflexota bacterium]